jgi:hypothetical protein
MVAQNVPTHRAYEIKGLVQWRKNEQIIVIIYKAYRTKYVQIKPVAFDTGEAHSLRLFEHITTLRNVHHG